MNENNNINKESLGRIAHAGLTGGIGAAGRKVTEQLTQKQVDKYSQKTANVIRKRRGQQTQSQTAKKKMSGAGFYIILGITILEDLLDIFLSPITPITSVIVSFIVFTYLYLENIDFDSRTIARWLISFIIELIPVINIIPTYSIIFYLTKVFENKKIVKGAALKFKRSSVIRKRRG
jgi:hypothetical protein